MFGAPVALGSVGCDGADNTVRTGTGIGWRGGDYRTKVVLADLDLVGDLATGVTHVVAGRAGLVFIFSLGEGAAWRLLATRAAESDAGPPGRSGPQVEAADLQRILDDAGLAARITDVAWSTRVRLQHRVATAAAGSRSSGGRRDGGVLGPAIACRTRWLPAATAGWGGTSCWPARGCTSCSTATRDCEGGVAGSAVLSWWSVAAGVTHCGTGFVPLKGPVRLLSPAPARPETLA